MNPTSDKDLELWRAWKRSKSMHDLEALMAQILPLIKKEVQKHAAVVSPLVLEAEAKTLALKAFESYDPSKGTKLSTHVTNAWLKLKRESYSRQSTVHVPEHQRITHNQYRRAAADLEDTLGHVPSFDHVADHMGLPPEKLRTLIANVEKRELMESGDGPSFQQEQDDTEKVDFAYHGLTPLQKQIFDYRTGLHGKVEIPNPEICKKLNIPQWKLSQELNIIRDRLKLAQGSNVHV